MKIRKIIVIIIGISVLSGCAYKTQPLETTEEIEQRITQEKANAIEMYMSSYVQDGVLSIEDVRKIIMAADEAHALDDARGPAMLQERQYHEKIHMIVSFANIMMIDTGRVRLAQNNTTITDEEIPVIDVITGMNKYYRQEEGEKRYRDYLAQRFDIGVYPSMNELVGEWTGEMVVTHVAVFHELGTAPIGYDVAAIKALEGRKDVVRFTLSSTSDTDGNMTPFYGGDYVGLPFAYDFVPDLSRVTAATYTYSEIKEKGLMVVRFAQTDIDGSMQLHASKIEELGITGSISIDLFDGYIKIVGTVSLVKSDE